MVIKHVSSKSSSYSGTVNYMEREHDEHGREIVGEGGKPVERYYRCEVLNVQSKYSFAAECTAANEYYHKNQGKEDVKQHQYIISFSPEESQKLTEEQAMQTVKEWTEKNLPGHQAILYLHRDGHNHAGNMHVHVNINSLRIKETEKKEWMNEPKFYREGMKHTCTGKVRWEMRASLNRIMREHGLDIKMQEHTGTRISEKEYYADRKGKAKNSAFDTQKEELRQCIKETAQRCLKPDGEVDFKEYIETLEKDYGVRVTESRGRFSYMHPEWDNRKKPVSDRKLGESYRKENLHEFGKQIYRQNSERYVGYETESIRGSGKREQKEERPRKNISVGANVKAEGQGTERMAEIRRRLAETDRKFDYRKQYLDFEEREIKSRESQTEQLTGRAERAVDRASRKSNEAVRDTKSRKPEIEQREQGRERANAQRKAEADRARKAEIARRAEQELYKDEELEL